MQVMFNRAMLTVQQHSADASSQDSSELSLRLYPAAASSSSCDQAPGAAQVCVPTLCRGEGPTDWPVCQASQVLEHTPYSALHVVAILSAFVILMWTSNPTGS